MATVYAPARRPVNEYWPWALVVVERVSVPDNATVTLASATPPEPVTAPMIELVRIRLPAKFTVTTWPAVLITAACVVDGNAASAGWPLMLTVYEPSGTLLIVY